MQKANSGRKGTFIAIEGPNGVGKTTILELIGKHLSATQCKVLKTKEPTESELGRWIRCKHEVVKGKALACLIAANRYEHVESVIQPALDQGMIVLTDRYLASSFVYQVSDGVPDDFIWAVNSQCLVADLTICFLARPESIADRMGDRGDFTRFERSLTPDKELGLYRAACKRLQRKGWLVEIYNNEDRLAEQIAVSVAEKILQLQNATKL